MKKCCHFFHCFSSTFQYQLIRCTDLIEINNDHFSSFKRFCQAPAYLLHGSLPNFVYRGRLEDCDMNKPMLNTALNNFVKFKMT